MRIEWLNQENTASLASLASGAAPVAADAAGVSRRGFMKAGAVAGGGLVLGFFLPGAGRLANAQQPPAKVYEPNAFLRIAPDNTVTVQVNRIEIGQGVHCLLYTSPSPRD